VDTFVFNWNSGYHIVNLRVILISGTVFTAVDELTKNPDVVLKTLASGILVQSQFYLNIVVVSAFQSIPLQLSQIVSVLHEVIVSNIISVEALSKRSRARMEEPKQFLFGRFCPQFVYCFMIAVMYR